MKSQYLNRDGYEMNLISMTDIGDVDECNFIGMCTMCPNPVVNSPLTPLFPRISNAIHSYKKNIWQADVNPSYTHIRKAYNISSHLVTSTYAH